MVKKFKNFNEEREYITNILKELNDIEYILNDEGVRYLTISYPNRNFRFPGIKGKDIVRAVPLTIKLYKGKHTKSEIIESDFFNEWLDHAEDTCNDRLSIYRHFGNVDINDIIIYFYYN